MKRKDKKERMSLGEKLLLTGIFLASVSFMSSVYEYNRQREISKKYKKIVKKGLFWDTIIYVERETPLSEADTLNLINP